MKGILALDIDGTLTADTGFIPEEVSRYLASLASVGWRVCVITGRSYGFAGPLLESFSFPFSLAVHNGAILVEMPKGRIMRREYLNTEIFSDIEKICKRESTDFIIYTGMENEDLCYYRPHCLEEKLLALLEKRAVAFRERWLPVDSFHEIPVTDFPTVKCFGRSESVRRIASDLEAGFGLHVPVIRDPFGEGLFIALCTKASVSKGAAVRYLKEMYGGIGPVIAAGDDYNDLPMFEEADVKIVMGTAPEDLKQQADVVAPSAENYGIISALKKVVTT